MRFRRSPPKKIMFFFFKLKLDNQKDKKAMQIKKEPHVNKRTQILKMLINVENER